MRVIILAYSMIVLMSCSSAFGKSKEYYKEVIVSGVFDCDTKCREHKVHYEIQDMSYRMIGVILLKISREIDNRFKEIISD